MPRLTQPIALGIMGQVSIISQEQITLPVSIRRRWGIEGAASLDLEFDEENNLVVLRPKPSVDEVLKYLSSLPRNRKAAPLVDVHEFYERERLTVHLRPETRPAMPSRRPRALSQERSASTGSRREARNEG